VDIVLKRCNNITEAKIGLQLASLNVKYGPNGTGKSTIAKATLLNAIGGERLLELQPFKYRGDKAPDKIPIVEGADTFKSVSVFNEDYVNQFVFQQDEIVRNSFDIFIKNADYDQKMKEIESLVAGIKQTFVKNTQIDEVLRDLIELSDSFGKSQTGYSKAGRIGKGLAKGNKVEHIPEKLTPYKPFIQSPSNVKWIKWQIEGNAFLPLSSQCPYCTSPTAEKKETILAVSQEYDVNAIGHLVALQNIIARLEKYFSAETIETVGKIIRNKGELKKEEINYLIGIKQHIDTLREKLNDARNLSFFSLRDVGKVQTKINAIKIDLVLLSHLNSVATKVIVDEVNSSLDSVLDKAAPLEGEINKQKKGIEKAITKYKDEINTFLRYAGYKYSVDIESEADAYKMKLKHQDFGEYISNGALHLSYGERNAFSLVLFMYDCLTKNPDLVVLDDPISSFDKTKKFAILEMLFRGKESFRGRTVLMLTHDIEPVIDLIKTLSHIFQPTAVASFLTCRDGVVSELPILKSDIQSFSQICHENIRKLDNVVIQLIYLRRHYEILNNRGNEYQLLSSLLHKRAEATTTIDGPDRPMTADEIAAGTEGVRGMFPAFDYAKALAELNDAAGMQAAYKASKNNYEKLQLYRTIRPSNHENNVVKKYINETFHIENEYVMQLNPHKYDFVPEHVVKECDQFLSA
jgi:ABC-type Mn2+/Zn2+ transport system ATPase subunit